MNRLFDLRVDEIAFVDRGANPEADVVLFKRYDENAETSRLDMLYAIWKIDAEDPRDFNDVREDRMASHVGDALWSRLDMLMSAFWDILFSEADDKAARIVESTNQFRDSLLNDIDAMMNGAIVKILNDNNAPSSGASKGGGIMPLDIEKLPEELREQATAQNELIAKIRKGLNLADDVSDEDVLKAFSEKIGQPVVVDPEPIDKSKLPESVVKLLEKQDAENTELRESVTKLTGEVTSLKDDAERREVREVAKTLSGDTDELTETLMKAKKAGVYDEVLKSLRGASEKAATADNLLKSLGHSSEVETADTAYGEVMKRAGEIRASDPSISEYDAVEKVLAADHALQKRYVEEEQERTRH